MSQDNAIESEISELVEKFELQPHPEGGFYKETYRSASRIPGGKNVMTVIYFLLRSQDVSKFHRIQGDEFWFFHKGSPLTVHTLDEKGHHQFKLGTNINNGESPQYLVPGNTIFGSSVNDENSYSFVSCAVAPGFEFSEFELFSREELMELFPLQDEIINKLT